ncbi:MAG: cell division protein FtsQ/DivIB [Gammaproteobacteria bacterium]
MAEAGHLARRSRALTKSIGIPALVCGAAVALWVGFRSLPFGLGPPLDHLVVINHGREVKASQVEALIRPDWSRGWLGFPLRRVRRRLERMPWVARASLERIFPDTLVVTVFEQHPIARLRRRGLVNRAGVLFYRGALPTRFTRLPEIRGPLGSLHALVRTDLAFGRVLKAGGFAIQTLTEDRRGGYRVRLSSGVSLRLGQGRPRARRRLMRFLNVVRPALGKKLNAAAYVDLRYVRGFAVGWRRPGAAPLHLRTRMPYG